MSKDIKKEFSPIILQDKQEFLSLLKAGKFKYSKYNVLNDQTAKRDLGGRCQAA